MAPASTSSTHPFVDPPRLSSRTADHFHRRKPSRSPARHHARDSDALLRDLSPTTTLRAFVTDPSQMAPSSDALVASISLASMAERSLGAKAAQTCLDLRAWTQEIDQWEWPGTFAEPQREQEGQMTASLQGPFTYHPNGTSTGHGQGPFWGSLPAELVQRYEARADEIGQALDEIDVEELKEYVLNSHYRISSRPPSRTDGMGEADMSTTTDLKRLDDFTALVTATILQALPFLTRLNRLLDNWTIRLIILRSAPRYLDDLKQATAELKKCWEAISPALDSTSAGESRTTFTRATMVQMRSSLEKQIGALGRRLDRFLDNLEGRRDRVPDAWIDDFEALERDYGAFVVQAERVVYENEWRQKRESASVPTGTAETAVATSAHPGNVAPVSETEDPDSDDDAIRRPSQIVRSSMDHAVLADHAGGNNPSPSAEDTSTAQPALVELSADETSKTGVRSISAPLSIQLPTAASQSASTESSPATSAFSRSASTVARDSEEGQGSVAAKRAAFLRDIERNQSLNKSTQSPVRPFERASNAFTRLFKKDRNAEQVLHSRSPSKAMEGRTSSAERAALSPVSLASFRSPMASPAISARSVASSSKSSLNDTDHTVAGDLHSRTSDQLLRGKSDSLQHNRSATTDCVGGAAPLVPSDNGGQAVSANGSSVAELPDKWPLSPAMERREQSVPVVTQTFAETTMPRMDTEHFDKAFVESFGPPKHDQGHQFELLAGRRRASLPHTDHASPKEASDPLQSARLAMEAPTPSRPLQRPKTAPSRPPALVVDINNLSRRPGDASDMSPDTTRSATRDSTSWQPGSANAGRNVEQVGTSSTFKFKRASLASIEAFTRADLKSIDVPKSSHNGSVSSRKSLSRTPTSVSRRTSTVEQIDSTAPLNDGTIPPVAPILSLPPARRPSLPATDTPQSDDAMSEKDRATQSRPSASTPPESPPAPLNAAMKKLRSKTLNSKGEETPSSSRSCPSSQAMNVHADSFDRHVSEVLERLPAPIRFKARPGAETPVGRPRAYSGTRPKGSAVRAPPKGLHMTIAPVEGASRKPRSAAEPEVKLYHLTHTGRDDPIKLFVRLVGEGERVMVRVGGGWADLADYLRDFANHHGSRTVSDGNLEVAALPTVSPSSRKVSSTAEYTRAKTPTPSTPRTLHRPGSSDDDEFSFRQPPSDARGNAGSTPSSSVDGLGLIPYTSKSSSSGSRPSTAGGSRPSSRQMYNASAPDIGLSGPSSATKRAGLPADKERWVEGMIERAKKSASAEKSKEEKEKYFSELSKAGGTRRVIFRSGSGTGPLLDRTNR